MREGIQWVKVGKTLQLGHNYIRKLYDRREATVLVCKVVFGVGGTPLIIT